MSTLIISAIGWRLLVSDLHQGKTPTTIIFGCRAVKDEQSFKDLAEARECLGIIEGMRVGSILQSHILKAPPPFCIPDNVARSQVVRCRRLHRPAVTTPLHRSPG